MRRFAPAVFAVALGQAIVVALPLGAQRRAALTVGVTTADRNHDGREPVESSEQLSPRPSPSADSTTKKLSLKNHVLVGVVVGAAGGAAFAIYKQNHSSYCDCFSPPEEAIPVLGAVAGGAVGALLGWLVYLARMSPPAP